MQCRHPRARPDRARKGPALRGRLQATLGAACERHRKLIELEYRCEVIGAGRAPGKAEENRIVAERPVLHERCEPVVERIRASELTRCMHALQAL